MGTTQELQTVSVDVEQQYYCAACGEPNDLFVEIAEGYRQSFVEECYACDKPNQILVRINPETGRVAIRSECVS